MSDVALVVIALALVLLASVVVALVVWLLCHIDGASAIKAMLFAGVAFGGVATLGAMIIEIVANVARS